MKPTRQSKVPPVKQLCILAREFRGTRDEQKRASVAREYAQAVRRLIDSKKWRRIPPLEDQLPDEWMPEAFFTYWSLRPPLRRGGKPAIIMEGMDDVAILRALLPPALLDACELRSTEGRTTFTSAARAHMIEYRTPTAILLDTDTLDQTVIAETVRATKDLVDSVADGRPFDVVCCIPHIEVVFFEGAIDLQRIFPKFKSVFIQKLAKTNPKRQLEALFEKGGGPGKLSDFLDELTSDEIEKLQSKDPIRQLIAFITNNRAPANSGRRRSV